jgi:hypothetical protein
VASGSGGRWTAVRPGFLEEGTGVDQRSDDMVKCDVWTKREECREVSSQVDCLVCPNFGERYQ